MISSLLFRFALIINGLGSCGVAIAIPYYLLSINKSPFDYYTTLSIIFLFTAAGSIFWGSILSRKHNLWKLKKKIVAIEVAISIILLLLHNYNSNLYIICILVAFLEFFFSFEIPWSRIAYKEIGRTYKISTAISSKQITIAASTISILAPALGCLAGSYRSLHWLFAFNIISYIPYYIWCCYYEKSLQLELEGEVKSYNFIDLLRDRNILQLIILVAAINLAMGIIVSSIPFVLFSAIQKQRELIVPMFYVITGLISTLVNQAISREKSKIINRTFSSILIIIFGGLTFIISGSVLFKAIGYILVNFSMISFSINVTKYIYAMNSISHESKLFSLLQLMPKVALFISSMFLINVSQSSYKLQLSSLYVVFTLIALVALLNNRKKETGI